MNGGKWCSKCRVHKLIEDFHRQAASPDGRRPECRDCANAYKRSPRGRDVRRARGTSEKTRERNRVWRAKNRSRLTAYERHHQALKRSLPSETVILHDIAVRDGAWCWVCGDELSEYNPAHLDHLVPILADAEQLTVWGVENPGTVAANMSLACPSCNIRKSNRVMLCALARYLRNHNAEMESELVA